MAKNIPTLSEMIANIRQQQPNPGIDTVAQGVTTGLDLRAAREKEAKEAELKNVLDQAKMRLQERETGAKELSAQADMLRATQPEKAPKPNYSVQETSKGLVAVNTANPTDIRELNYLRPKAQQALDAAATRLETEKTRAKTITDKVDTALGQVGMFSTGKGSIIGDIPLLGRGSDARDLKGTIDTIKANLGFEQLQKMRESSPTGGALGQIAVRELEFLQAAVANLDPEQSQEQVTANLNEIKTRYNNWLKTVEQAQAEEGSGAASTTPQTQSSGFKVKARRKL